MGVPTAAALGTLRLSVGRFTTEEDVREAAQLVVTTVNGMYKQMAEKSSSSQASVLSEIQKIAEAWFSQAQAQSEIVEPSSGELKEKEHKEEEEKGTEDSRRRRSGPLEYTAGEAGKDGKWVCLSGPLPPTRLEFQEDTYRYTSHSTLAASLVLPSDAASGDDLSINSVPIATARPDWGPAILLLHSTVFHAQGGGQPSDIGFMCAPATANFSANAEDMKLIDFEVTVFQVCSASGCWLNSHEYTSLAYIFVLYFRFVNVAMPLVVPDHWWFTTCSPGN